MKHYYYNSPKIQYGFKKKIYEECGTDFLHQEWGIASSESIKVRLNIPKDKLTILDRYYKDTTKKSTDTTKKSDWNEFPL